MDHPDSHWGLLKSLLDEHNSTLLAVPLLGNQLTCDNLLTTILNNFFLLFSTSVFKFSGKSIC